MMVARPAEAIDPPIRTIITDDRAPPEMGGGPPPLGMSAGSVGAGLGVGVAAAGAVGVAVAVGVASAAQFTW